MRAEKSLSFLFKFAEIFTFATPRLFFWGAALKYINGKTSKAESDWAKAAEAAKQLKMKYDEAFVLFMKVRQNCEHLTYSLQRE
jgi:hypothetical protein